MEKNWWHSAIAYQIYPRSFKDSNNDGIGDIRGIINKLDYLQDLGINVIWISPIFKSPMVDNGYDISDYYDINPEFGTIEELEELIKEADIRGIKVLMDLVINHSSNEHPWFKNAIEDPNGKYADYYIFKEGIGDNPPNNWRSIFGGSAWERVPNTNSYYLHLFAKEQPDLNWENEELREELYKMINFWLDKGLGGFRVDAITYIKKPKNFDSLPPDAEDGLASLFEITQNNEGIGEFLMELRHKTFDKYNAMTVGEASGVDVKSLEKFIGPDGYFSSIFDFDYTDLDVGPKGFWYDYNKITSQGLKDAIYESQLISQQVGFKSNILENHDLPRGINKFLPAEEINYHSTTMLGTISLMLRGIPFIYQGQEIGMTNCKMDSIADFDDIATHDQYSKAILDGLTEKEALDVVNRRSRDNTRTPFQWDSSQNAGFTEGKPWLKVNPNYKDINAAAQINDQNSVLSYYKKLIQLRKNKNYQDTIINGTFVPTLLDYQNIIAYFRRGNNNSILVINNFDNNSCEVEINVKGKRVLLNNYNELIIKDNRISLKPYQSVIFGD
jgi:oligo-1,6-glucosidase